MTQSEKEALESLTGMIKMTNDETIQRNEQYYDTEGRFVRPSMRDSLSTRESVISPSQYKRYLDTNPRFFEDHKLTAEEMVMARAAAEAARDENGNGYGFAGFVEEPKDGGRRASEIEELKNQQNAVLSETKKTNELLAQLVSVLSSKVAPAEQADAQNAEQ